MLYSDDTMGDAEAEERGTITAAAHEWSNGSKEAMNRLFELLYDVLKGIAHRQLNGKRRVNYLDTTEVVHETWIRLQKHERIEPMDQRRLEGFLARIMRHVRVDHARAASAKVRNPSGGFAELDSERTAMLASPDYLVALTEFLRELGSRDPVAQRVLSLKLVGHYENDIAECLGIGRATVQRKWTAVKRWIEVAV